MPYLESPIAARSHDNCDPTLSLVGQHVVYLGLGLGCRMAFVICVQACTDYVTTTSCVGLCSRATCSAAGHITPQANFLSVLNSGEHTTDPSSVLHQDIDIIARLHMCCKKKIMGSRYSLYFTTTLNSTPQIVKRECGGE